MAPFGVINCNIVDVVRGSFIKDGTLVIEGRKLKYVGPKVEIGDVEYVNAGGCWAIPGLIDAHVHLCEEPNPEQAKVYRYDERDLISGLRCGRNLHKALRWGITLLRDCGSYQGRSLQVKQAVVSGIIAGPRIVTCGRLITVPNGHAEYLGKTASTLEELERAINEEIELGADFLKIANYPVAYSGEALKSFVDMVHSRGKLACCHTGDEESVRLAVEASFDTIEHAVPFDDEMALQMRQRGCILVPTYICALATCEDIGLSLITEEDLRAIFRPWLQGIESGLPGAIKMGVKIAAGTDAGFPPVDFDALHGEIQKLCEFGASPLTALQAATLIAAQACGLADKVGSLEEGKLADVLLINRNPLEDITATREIQMVMINGKVEWINSHQLLT